MHRLPRHILLSLAIALSSNWEGHSRGFPVARARPHQLGRANPHAVRLPSNTTDTRMQSQIVDGELDDLPWLDERLSPTPLWDGVHDKVVGVPMGWVDPSFRGGQMLDVSLTRVHPASYARSLQVLILSTALVRPPAFRRTSQRDHLRPLRSLYPHP